MQLCYTSPEMSLYRTYRPAQFADVVGQEHVVTTLSNAVEQDKLAHAYLFSGSRGTGKTSIARILAKEILTKGVQDETLKKQIAKGVEDGSIVDLIEIDAASNRGIDDIRMLVEKIQFSPVVASAKVYIIDEVHMLTKEAFNALLKTLEEPPPYAFFILATTELQKIPATIQSRCQRFTFRHIRPEDIVGRLRHIADIEKISIGDDSLMAIAHHAQGGLRDAISLLDQLRSLETVTLTDVEERLGQSGAKTTEHIMAAFDSGDKKAILQHIRTAEEAGLALDTLARDLLGTVRTRLHASIAANQPTDQWLRMLDALLDAVRSIRIAPVPGLVLEAALLSLLSPIKSATIAPSAPVAPATSPPAPIKKLMAEEMKEKASSEIVKEKMTEIPVAPPPPAASAPGTIQAPEITMENIIQAWPQFMENAKPPSVKMSLKNGRIIGVKDRTVLLQFGSRFHRDRVMSNDAIHHLEELLTQHFKVPMRLDGIVEEENESAAAAVDVPEVDLADAASEIF